MMRLKCPHCGDSFANEPIYIFLGEDAEAAWKIIQIECTSCCRFIFFLVKGTASHYIYLKTVDHEATFTKIEYRNIEDPPMRYLRDNLISVLGSRDRSDIEDEDVISTTLIRPKAGLHLPCPTEVPAHIAEDYNEAYLVLADSPKASAALSRRCLQNLLRDVVKVKPSDLSKEIQQVLDSGQIPSYIAETIDAIRNIGNFAAHPIKSQNSGEILPIEPQEAEWNLEVLEKLFDFYCVQPVKIQRMRQELNRKLQEAGKNSMK